MTKKQYPKLKKSDHERPFAEIPDQRDILAITEVQNWKPVTRKGRFINANYPPEDATREEAHARLGQLFVV
jgi:hypothetical protein